MKDKRNASLRDALLKAVAIAAFTAVPATAFAPIASATVYLDDVNDGDCDLDAASDTGVGSASNPFRISTAEDLAEITDCNYAGEYYYEMVNDIDLTPNGNYNNDGFDWNGLTEGWSPIGQVAVTGFTEGVPNTISDEFTGHFDGNGHTISNLTIDNTDNDDSYLGLFSETEYSSITNLNLEVTIDAGDDYADYVGALTGSDYDSTITNVHAVVDITNGDDSIGGLVGDASGSRISRSSTSGTIQGWNDYSENVGGIVGYGDDGYQQTVLTNVSSSVEINDISDGNDDSAYFEEIGGIIGYAEDAVINHATFSGSVFGNWRIGGIAGYHGGSLISNAVVTEDAIVAAGENDDAYEIGGIVGEFDYGTINNVTFSGTLDSSLDDYETYSVGGVVGSTYYANIVGATVTADASISARGYDNDSGQIGGIVGYADETSITGAANHADFSVIDADYVGGIVGEADQSQVSNSINRGNIVVTLDDISFSEGALGGIVGYLDDNSHVSNSTNKGDLTLEGLEDTYGVGGIAGYSNAEVSILDSYNTGDVTGVYNVAGIIGYADNNWTQIERTYSLGKLTAFDSDADGIATIDPEDGYIVEPSNAVLVSDSADNVTEAMELTASALKAGLRLVDAGWAINLEDGSVDEAADWKTSSAFNSGYPSLAWETVSEDLSEPVGLVDTAFEAVQFNGGKRFTLTLEERNYLNSVAATINEHPYSSVDVDVYYGSKFKLAGKRAKTVKRYLIRRFVGAPISVHIMQADGDHAVGSVHITALVD